MQCKNHPTAKGVNTCNQCGSWLCERCSFEHGGRIFCPSCAADNGTEATSYHAHSPGSAKYISWGLLFLFSVVIPLPGLNYMYMGLIKRGLLAMSAFFGLIFMTSQLSGGSSVFAFAIPILIITCIFDGFNLRRRINAGEEVNDNIDEIINAIRRNRRIIASFVILLVVVRIVGIILPSLGWIVPLIFVVWAVLTFFSKPRR